MSTRAFRSRELGRLVLVRPLRDGDVETVAAVFERLSPESRAHRFHGAKPRLPDGERVYLARVDADRHVLVAHVDGDAQPAALARLVRCPEDRRAAEIAFEVADCYQGAGIGTTLVELLLGDARAAGFARITADVELSNRGALTLLGRLLGRTALRVEGSDVRVEAPLGGVKTAPPHDTGTRHRSAHVGPICIPYERRWMPAVTLDRLDADAVRAGEYGATVRDEGHSGANAGRAGRSCRMGFEPVFVIWPPLRLARMRFERGSVGVVCPPVLRRQPLVGRREHATLYRA